jgi:hypothetical protein
MADNQTQPLGLLFRPCVTATAMHPGLLVAGKSLRERHEMKVIEIAFSCYPVTDLKRAGQFYEGILGLKESRRFGDSQRAWVE